MVTIGLLLHSCPAVSGCYSPSKEGTNFFWEGNTPGKSFRRIIPPCRVPGSGCQRCSSRNRKGLFRQCTGLSKRKCAKLRESFCPATASHSRPHQAGAKQISPFFLHKPVEAYASQTLTSDLRYVIYDVNSSWCPNDHCTDDVNPRDGHSGFFITLDRG